MPAVVRPAARLVPTPSTSAASCPDRGSRRKHRRTAPMWWAPATPTPAPPPPERPAARSITETDLLGTEAEKREQAEIRAAPFRRPLNDNRRNPFLG